MLDVSSAVLKLGSANVCTFYVNGFWCQNCLTIYNIKFEENPSKLVYSLSLIVIV